MKPSDSKKKAEPRVWGLTGGIASGKSLVAKFFAEEGVPVIDADEIARELRGPGGAAHELIQKRFGTVDPSKLREIVFTDPSARKDLEAILHPLIQKESGKRIEAALQGREGAVPVLYEATLLVETGRYRDLQGLIVVVAEEEVRIQRLIARDRSSRELAQRILASQLGDAERRDHATFVIENDGSIENLKAQVRALLPRLSNFHRSKS